MKALSASASTEPTELRGWEQRPKAAFLISALAVIAPVAVGFATGFAANHILSPALGLVRFAVVAILSSAAAWFTEHQTRRMGPIAALMRMSLVLPDNAPSRFKVAMRAGALSKMQSRLIAGQAASDYDGMPLGDLAAEMVALATALRSHDRRTRGHCERVRAYADLIGEEMGLSDSDRQKLQWAALLHDVGKMAVPAAILNKPGKPDPEEWAVLQNHPAAAKAFLAPLSGWLGPWTAAAWEHHERWDGTGYPNRLAGTDITLSGRIVAVADAFEVMTAVRSYKKPIPAPQARAELARCAGSHFDPQVVRAMMAVSLRRLSAISGPLSLIAQLPFLGWTASPGALPVAALSAGRTVVLASAVGAGVVTASVTGVTTTPSTTPPGVTPIARTVTPAPLRLTVSRFNPQLVSGQNAAGALVTPASDSPAAVPASQSQSAGQSHSAGHAGHNPPSVLSTIPRPVNAPVLPAESAKAPVSR